MQQNKSQIFGMSIIGILFFIFGFVTWLNSVLIPFLKEICYLSDFEAYFVTFAFYISYFVMALPSSWVLRKVGFVRGMSLGLGVMGLGSLVFIPAAHQQNFFLFLAGLFAQGAGLALLQTASNPYVTILGPIESAAQRMSIMGICNKVAGMIGIFLLSQVLLGDITDLSCHLNQFTGSELQQAIHDISSRITLPYIIMAVVLFALAAMVHFAKLPEVHPEELKSDISQKKQKSIFNYPYFWLGVLALFLYVGAEVVAIDTLSLYGKYWNLSDSIATKLGTFSLIALTAGYLLSIITVPKFISQRKALLVCALLDIAFLAGVLLTNGTTSIVFVILLSFGHAIMWPAIWPLAIHKLGRHTEVASAILIMGIAGGAIVPLIYGALVDSLDGNRQLPYLLLLASYLFIIFFATIGYKIEIKEKEK